jgi:hypothetical protein
VFEDKPGPTGVEGVADQPLGAGATGGVRGQLCRFPREGAQGSAKPIYAGHPALLRGGTPSSRPQLHLTGRHFCSHL